jgi:hypothetical protein
MLSEQGVPEVIKRLPEVEPRDTYFRNSQTLRVLLSGKIDITFEFFHYTP